MHVVVVAYGSRADARRAVGQVRGWGNLASSLSVVAASPVSDVAPGAFDAVTIPTTLGSAGIREVAGTAAVLVIHDDVRLDVDGARELIARLETAPIAVATDRDGRAGLACFAARSLETIEGAIVLPGARENDDASRVDVRARHSHSCRRQLLDDRLDGAEPLLVASMIVKNEEKHLPEALASVAGLVDRIDICDTGSTDSTMSIIRRHGGRIREIEWRNDFAWARNEALTMCGDATFALMFDADERIAVEDTKAFRRWLRTWAHELDAIKVRVDNERDIGVASSINSIRIARPGASRFDGAIHEVLTVTGPDGQSTGRIATGTGMAVVHLGYRSDVVQSRNKHQRNIDIARATHDADPSAKTAVDLARSLMAVDPDSDEAVELFDSVADTVDPETTATAYSYIFAMRAQHAYRRGNHREAANLAKLALDRTPNEDIALATAAAALLALGRSDELVALHAETSNRPPGVPLFTVPRNATRYRAMVGYAHVCSGSLEQGLELLEHAMDADPAGAADLVAKAVPEILAAGADPSSLVPLIARDETGHITTALASQVPPSTTASISLAGLMLGEPHAAVVTVQLSAALIAGAHDLASAGLAFTDVLDSDTRSKLADLAVRKNQPDIAAGLVAAVPTKTGEPA
ncbi:MAG: glycosyltransferase [Acidimicrobiia bacterium]|nr:glycosyltransferase [Acidimicrobiia bacterium]